MRFNLLRDGVKVRPFAGFEFGINEFTVDANFKSTSARRDQFHRLDPGDVANFGRQTGGPWFVVSSRAVFDRDVRFHRAPSELSLSVVEERVNPAASVGCAPFNRAKRAVVRKNRQADSGATSCHPFEASEARNADDQSP